jgi:hypothetical protein
MCAYTKVQTRCPASWHVQVLPSTRQKVLEVRGIGPVDQFSTEVPAVTIPGSLTTYHRPPKPSQGTALACLGGWRLAPW